MGVYLQVENLIVCGRPTIVLRFGGVLSLFVTQIRANQVDVHKGLEHGVYWPFQFVAGDN